MKVAIMQPYFLPYIGYYQLLSSVDKFVIYDNIKYTKKGWINRNRMLACGKETIFSLPIKKDSDKLNVVQRELSADYKREKMLNNIKGAYQKAPFFEKIYPIISEVVNYRENNLFYYIYNSIVLICKYLSINTEIIISSTIEINHELKSQSKVIAICKAVKADTYINPIGGVGLYSSNIFEDNGISLRFHKIKNIEYNQCCSQFIQCLSIIDVLMYNSLDTVKDYIVNKYELI